MQNGATPLSLVSPQLVEASIFLLRGVLDYILILVQFALCRLLQYRQPSCLVTMEKSEPEVLSANSEPASDQVKPSQLEDGLATAPQGVFGRLNAKVSSVKYLEERGIERVPETERYKKLGGADYMQMTLLWFSTNITANNIAVGMLGPADYGLGFTDSALCSAFGALLGGIGVGYVSTFGPASGNRTMVLLCPVRVFRDYG